MLLIDTDNPYTDYFRFLSQLHRLSIHPCRNPQTVTETTFVRLIFGNGAGYLYLLILSILVVSDV